MRICILSDSHGRRSLLWEIICTEKPDSIYFLGDGLRDLDETEDVPTVKVGGNCDLFAESYECVLTLQNKKVLLTHGHRYGVKQGLLNLSLYAEEIQADAVFYGHTHVPSADERNGMLFVCPGAVKDGRYALLTAENGDLKVELKSL